MSTREHWEAVYSTKDPKEVSWYSPHLQQSLVLIRQVAPVTSRIIDVGAGASTLVDDLLDAGYRKLTVLDISDAALATARARLGDRAAQVLWLSGDVTTLKVEPDSFDLWHDRAVFHFLTSEADRNAYLERLRRSVVSGGHAIIATFSLAGPAKCSGLDVVRYDAVLLSRQVGSSFSLVSSVETTHMTPAGKPQPFVFCVFKKL